MPASTTNAARVAVLADSDTRWKWGALTARRIAPDREEQQLDGFLLRGRATPTPRQLQEIGVRAGSLSEVTAVEFLRHMEREDAPYDLVVLALVGGGVQALLHGLARVWEGRPRRPVVVTGYVGVVYEKLADGLLLRHGADLVLANSRQDAERFRGVYEGVGADPAAVTECALPFLDGAAGRTAKATADATAADAADATAHAAPTDAADPATPASPATPTTPLTVVFAVQPSVPESRADRVYLLRRAIAHAGLHPDREVLVKLRSRPGEHTTHIEEHPYQRLVRTERTPDNFRLVYGHMGEVLDRAGLLVTVSSTAALESLHRSIPTAVLTDLGIREPLGNHHFIGSGCLASWNQLDAGLLPTADPAWTARQGVAADRPYESSFDTARARVEELLAAPSLAPVEPYYTTVTAPGYLPGILARHHLGPDGTPLPGAAAASVEPGPVRQAVRHAARGAYRHGVQRVAPVIRRMGGL
ncbi:DUF6716 putative glycosyltransferase [Streptomyces tsukubensis]|uniref:Uncharacterized protein n=1 Tax=Streptomyces tsukubensis TaxID=83656 RepID=A0A1V4A447_9ACTN|nr:DUF6716 putative glycosyltransferase [Streptomyces tsukubensis]OON74383.1 hypothetical protein B1H18_25130 [Streptomyces tsukubensis]QFR95381.1 hypothetical protein GBW32_23080 [Streptomyces tsukubensis]